MAAKVKETVLGADLADPQKGFEEPGQGLFRLGRGRHIIGVQLGPVKALPGFRRGGDLIGLGDQPGQVE